SSDPAPNRIHIRGDLVTGAFAYTKPRATPDCGDIFQDDNTDVYGGSIADDIHSRPRIWAVFKSEDDPNVRADDIAHVLGTIVVHEVLHASGLLQCKWMQGDITGHNDPRFERGKGHRYASGQHLMDTFAMVTPEVLVGRSNTPSGPRPDLANDSFAANYLLLIHPKP
ncbi:MAG TPA: hypothetical protein VN181_08745, partial [Thermoanaerobaculia bacterium]|nr:hypothetical protein [Thermoanaerobaculia bacterium]